MSPFFEYSKKLRVPEKRLATLQGMVYSFEFALKAGIYHAMTKKVDQDIINVLVSQKLLLKEQ